jgi:hypothetical protein
MNQIANTKRLSSRHGGFGTKATREGLVTKRQLARHLNFSERWVEMEVRKGLPHLKVGSRLRFRISDVEAYFDEVSVER